jgi:hypothetical protein
VVVVVVVVDSVVVAPKHAVHCVGSNTSHERGAIVNTVFVLLFEALVWMVVLVLVGHDSSRWCDAKGLYKINAVLLLLLVLAVVGTLAAAAAASQSA